MSQVGAFSIHYDVNDSSTVLRRHSTLRLLQFAALQKPRINLTNHSQVQSLHYSVTFGFQDLT